MKLDRLDLIGPPSPVRRLDALSRAWDYASIWTKDDAQLGRLGGGTKLRNLEFLIGDALAGGASRLVVLGLWRSNFIRTVARYARLFDLPVTAIVGIDTRSGTTFFPRDFGAGVTVRPVSMLRLALADRLVRALGPRLGGASGAYWLAIGGASAVGCQGPLHAALELRDQIVAGQMPTPRAIVLPLGSGGTAAGMAAGLRLAGFAGELIAARVCGGPGPRALARKARRAMAMFAPGRLPVPIRIEDARQSLDPATFEQLKAIAGADGLEPDAHYTGPALNALLGVAVRGGPGSDVLFWNTRSRNVAGAPLAAPGRGHGGEIDRAFGTASSGALVPCG